LRDAQTELLHVGQAGGFAGLLARTAEDREENGREERYYGYNY
jgi:hypothetical protein